MWPNSVVMDAPLLNQNARFIKAVEQCSVQDLVAAVPFATFTIAILPRATWFDIRSLSADAPKHVAQYLRYEFRPVVASDIARNTFLQPIQAYRDFRRD